MAQALNPSGNWKIRNVLLTTVGISVVIAGLILPHLRPVKLSLEALAIVAGSAVALRSLVALASAEAPKPAREATLADTYTLPTLIVIFLILATPFLVFGTVRAGYRTPLDFNEGMNAYYTTRLLHGGSLYPPLTEAFPITPLNYPPLSFLIWGALDRLTGAPVLTGRTVSLLAMLGIAWMLFRIIDNLGISKPAAVLGACFWLALMARYGPDYVGTYDPQLLGQVFSIGAVYLYSKWLDHMTFPRVAALALLCCLALFIKLLYIAVPLSLALAIGLRNRRLAGTFATTGVLIFLLLTLSSWAYWGTDLFRNLSVEIARERTNGKMLDYVLALFFTPFGFATLEVLIVLFLVRRRVNGLGVVYPLIAAAAGFFVVRGEGVGINAWFDLFAATAIAVGLFAAEVTSLKVTWARRVLYLLLACTVLPLLPHLQADLGRALDYGALRRDEQTYLQDVNLLRSIPGPALVEFAPLALDANKELLFDPFFGSELILAGRLPENTLTDRIRQRYFGAIVLSFDLHEKLAKLRSSALPRTPASRDTWTRWTDNTLLAIGEYYEPLDPRPRHRYIRCPGECPFFYVPRKPDT